MEFFRIDPHTKLTTSVLINPAEAPLVFGLDLWALTTFNNGASRTCVDVAFHIAESQATEPLFLDNFRMREIEDFLDAAPQSLIVMMNPLFSPDDFLLLFNSSDRLERRDRPFPESTKDQMFTIGVNDALLNNNHPYFDVVLNPYFNPVIYDQTKTSSCTSQQIRIDYTCAPSRIRPDISKLDLFSMQSLKQEKKPKVIAVYFRYPDETSDRKLLENILKKFKKLYRKHSCHFLVSTGPATPQDQAKKIENCLTGFPGSEFYNFNEHKGSENPFENFLNRADVIIVTDDTVSSLSDAIATGKPVLLHTTAHRARHLYSSDFHAYDRNSRLQQALMRQGRIKLFTERNLMSGWRPAFIDEWKMIGDTITGVLQERKMNLLTPRLAKSYRTHSGRLLLPEG